MVDVAAMVEATKQALRVVIFQFVYELNQSKLTMYDTVQSRGGEFE